jgi:hypothetical protein
VVPRRLSRRVLPNRALPMLWRGCHLQPTNELATAALLPIVQFRPRCRSRAREAAGSASAARPRAACFGCARFSGNQRWHTIVIQIRKLYKNMGGHTKATRKTTTLPKQTPQACDSMKWRSISASGTTRAHIGHTPSACCARRDASTASTRLRWSSASALALSAARWAAASWAL